RTLPPGARKRKTRQHEMTRGPGRATTVPRGFSLPRERTDRRRFQRWQRARPRLAVDAGPSRVIVTKTRVFRVSTGRGPNSSPHDVIPPLRPRRVKTRGTGLTRKRDRWD